MPVAPRSVSAVVLPLDVPVHNFRDALCLPTSPKQGRYFRQAADSQAFLTVRENQWGCAEGQWVTLTSAHHWDWSLQTSH